MNVQQYSGFFFLGLALVTYLFYRRSGDYQIRKTQREIRRKEQERRDLLADSVSAQKDRSAANRNWVARSAGLTVMEKQDLWYAFVRYYGPDVMIYVEKVRKPMLSAAIVEVCKPAAPTGLALVPE